MNYESMRPIRKEDDPFTRFPNSYLDNMDALNPYEFKILALLVRKTYGWNRESDKISISQFAELTGISRQMVQKSLKSLEEKGLITKEKSYQIGESGAAYSDTTRWGVIFSPEEKEVGNDESDGRQQESRGVGNEEAEGVGNDVARQKKEIKEKKENNISPKITDSQIQSIIDLYPTRDEKRTGSQDLLRDTKTNRETVRKLIKKYGEDKVRIAVLGYLETKKGGWLVNFKTMLGYIDAGFIKKMQNALDGKEREDNMTDDERYDYSGFGV